MSLKFVIMLLGIFNFCIGGLTAASDMKNKQQPNRDILNIFSKYQCAECHIRQENAGDSQGLSDQIIDRAILYYDMTPLYKNLKSGKAVNEVDLAKLYITLLKRPHANIKDSKANVKLSHKDQKILNKWIKQGRIHYHYNDIPDQFKNDFVRPITTVFEVDENKVLLGSQLFHSTKLSIDDTVSCSSCHGMATGGVDGFRTSIGVDKQIGKINAPTVYNAAFHISQFWDGRAADLEAQAEAPPLNSIEMASKSWDEIIKKLQKDRSLKEHFDTIYSDGITKENIVDAIAEFEKTLITPDSPFDQYLKGDESALSDQEKKGYALFVKYECASCHTGEAMGGLSYDVMSREGNYILDRGNEITEDKGRFNVTNNKDDMYRFKVPTLRNIELTAPYLHDGSVNSLKEAMVIKAKYQLGITLSNDELKQMVAFLKTLTGRFRGESLRDFPEDHMK